MALPIPRELRVDDPPGGGGPLPALAAALDSRRYDEVCVLSVDLPLLSAEALEGAAGETRDGSRRGRLAGRQAPAARDLVAARSG
jgi:molybdopterin-guanine dinucleotide biosynthesis protein A